jgi:hypothetical protein
LTTPLAFPSSALTFGDPHITSLSGNHRCERPTAISREQRPFGSSFSVCVTHQITHLLNTTADASGHDSEQRILLSAQAAILSVVSTVDNSVKSKLGEEEKGKAGFSPKWLVAGLISARKRLATRTTIFAAHPYNPRQHPI